MGAKAPVKYHYFHRFFTYSVRRRAGFTAHLLGIQGLPCEVDPSRRQCQEGSLAGAAHLSKDNAGVLRLSSVRTEISRRTKG